MSDGRIRAVIVDDHPIFRDGLIQSLGAEPDIEVVGQGATADDAVRLAREVRPDILLLDISMPGGGLRAAETVASAAPATRIVVLTASEEEHDVLAAFKAGVRAYVVKGIVARELIRIIRMVSSGQGYVPPTVAASLMAELAAGTIARPGSGPLDELTEREGQILGLVADGLSNKEIGHQLGLTEKTVKYYVTNVFQKLGVRNRVEAALLARGTRRPASKRE